MHGYVSKGFTKARLYPAMRVFWRISRKWVGRSPTRAYSRRVASLARAHLRFDERRRQTLKIEILRILGYHAPTTTTILAFVVSKLYFGKVARCVSLKFQWRSLHDIFRMRMCCTIARRWLHAHFFKSRFHFIRNKVNIIFTRAYIFSRLYKRFFSVFKLLGFPGINCKYHS